MEWRDYNTSAQFRHASETLLSLIQKATAPAKFLLNDTEKLKIIGLSDQAWVRESFLDRLFASGLRRVAMVNSIHYFTRVGIQEIMRNQPSEQGGGSGPATEYFATRDEALRWLTS